MSSMNCKTTLKRVIVCLCIVATVVACPKSSPAANPFLEYDLPIYESPDVQSTLDYKDFQAGLLELWMKALQRPDAELKRMVIDSMIIAHQKGLKGVDAIKPDMVALLKSPDQSLDLVRSASNALVVLDSRDHASLLAEVAASYGGSASQIIEPALAKWQSSEMIDQWLARVRDSSSNDTQMILAIQGLGQLKSNESRELLLDHVRNRAEPTSIRLASARSLAMIDAEGLVETATKLAKESTERNPLGSLLAIEMLATHSSDEASDFLDGLLSEPSTAVQAGALAQLLRIDPQLVERRVDEFVTSVDSSVRTSCARSMLATKKPERVKTLAAMLDDENPSLRREVANGLIEFTKLDGMSDEVITQTSKVLAQDSWRGCEQAIVVLAKLDHRDAGPRFVELLSHDRGEVKVASAWGLAQLRIKELLPDMLEHAQRVYDGFASGEINDNMPGFSDQVAHLFIAMGDQRYAAADPLMRLYIPKNMLIGQHPRPAAIWALGWIHEAAPEEELVKLLLGRLNDVSALEPEMEEVRFMSAISLGRMKAESALPDLRKYAGPAGGSARASAWAIEQLTGEPAPGVPRNRIEIGGWFLSPIPEWSK